MKIVLASSEAVPFSKTGGLADVASALAKSLSAAGHDVHLMTPYYPQQFGGKGPRPVLEPSDIQFPVTVGNRTVLARLWRSTWPGSRATVWLIDQPQYFDRRGIYVEGERDYADNCERFVFFSRAVCEATRVLKLQPDIIHANDWQTGLIPALLAAQYRQLPEFSRTASVYTIHNLAFQGRYWHWDMMLTGLDWKYFNWRQMEFFGDLNLMKTGIAFADAVTTVSPTYAREIQTSEFGCGLEESLSARRLDLTGILNGIDTEEWNPATDTVIAKNYDITTAATDKAACKGELQQRMGLPFQPYAPLVAMVSRMTGQKGFQLVTSIAEDLMRESVQLVILGSGESGYEQALRDLAGRHSAQTAVRIGYDEALSHQIIAGADLFLVPSLYEPCGLTQMYSLRYGTVPVVRATGGLADSVIDYRPGSASVGNSNGFLFWEFSPNGLLEAIRRAVATYGERSIWLQLVRNGMQQDWSWSRSASEYLAVYQKAQQKLG